LLKTHLGLDDGWNSSICGNIRLVHLMCFFFPPFLFFSLWGPVI
jgi:hypothetical protein